MICHGLSQDHVGCVRTRIGSAALGTSQREWNQHQSTDRSVVIGVGLAWAVVSGASAIYGYRTANACHAAQSQLMLRMMREPVPPTWPPPPVP